MTTKLVINSVDKEAKVIEVFTTDAQGRVSNAPTQTIKANGAAQITIEDGRSITLREKVG